MILIVLHIRTIAKGRLPRGRWHSRLLERFSITMFAVNGRLRCANRPYSKAMIACFEPLLLSIPRTANSNIGRGSLLISPDFPQTSPSLHRSPFPLHKSPVFSAHCAKGPACHRGGEGPVVSREQDDERLDKVRAGRGCGAGGELLGRQRACGGDIADAGEWPRVCG